MLRTLLIGLYWYAVHPTIFAGVFSYRRTNQQGVNLHEAKNGHLIQTPALCVVQCFWQEAFMSAKVLAAKVTPFLTISVRQGEH